MKRKIIYNGKYFEEATAIIAAAHMGLRYGHGCFETIKTINGKIILKDLHFGRLFSSLDSLGFDLPETFTAEMLEEKILSLLKKNGHKSFARVRLNVFSSTENLETGNNQADYLLESWELNDGYGFNEDGWVVDIYNEVRKSCDHFSHLKSNNRLPYIMAANWAQENQINDAILLNSYDRIADATIANVFIVKDGILKTPSLPEGCIGGVMRKFLINSCRKEGIPVEETSISVDELHEASEVFLTNAIKGIRWVKEAGESGFTCQVSKLLYKKIIQPLWD